MRRPPALAVVLVVALAACGRCTRDRAAAPERHLPAVRVAVVIPDVGAAQREAREVLATASRFPAAAGLPDWLAALRAQLGFDPLTAEGLESAGLDPDGGAAWAETAEGPLLVLPLADGAAFEEAVARLARDRIGAAQRSESARGAARIVTLARTRSGPAEIAYALAGKVAILGRGAGAPDAVGRAATLEAKDTLAETPAWKAAAGALGRGHVLVGFVAPQAPRAAGSWLASLWRDGAAVGLSGSSDRVLGRAVLLLGPARQPAWREIAGNPLEASGEDLGRLPKDAFAVARFGGDTAPLARRLLWAFPGAARALAEAGVDAERDLVPALAPGAAIAISLAPTFDVTAVSRGGSDAALGDPFRSFHVAAFTRVSSRERAVAALDALTAAARRSNLEVAAPPGAGPAPAPAATPPRPARGTKRTPTATPTATPQPAASPPAPIADGARWTFTAGAARLDVVLTGDRLLVAGGPQRIDELERLARDGHGWAPPTSGMKKLATGGAGAVVLDFGNLVRSARALPASAYGTGPDAFVMRSITDRILDPASRLEVAGVRVDLDDGAVRADFVVEARAGAEPRP